MNRDILSELSAFFPMAVYTGHKLVMLSPEHEVTISRACGSEPFCPASVQRGVVVEVWRTEEETEKKLVSEQKARATKDNKNTEVDWVDQKKKDAPKNPTKKETELKKQVIELTTKAEEVTRSLNDTRNKLKKEADSYKKQLEDSRAKEQQFEASLKKAVEDSKKAAEKLKVAEKEFKNRSRLRKHKSG